MSNAKTVEVIEDPIIYEDSPDIPEEHRDRVIQHIRELDQTLSEFRDQTDACYEAKSIEDLEAALEPLEFEVRREFFFGLSSSIPDDLPEDAILWTLAQIDQEDPKKAAEWCAALDPHYGTAYAMGWVRKQQMRIAYGLPNDVSKVQSQQQLEEEAPAKQLTFEPLVESENLSDRVLGTTEHVLDTCKSWWRKLRKKEKKE